MTSATTDNRDVASATSPDSANFSVPRVPVNSAALASTAPVDNLSQLPLDVFCEILSQVRPHDLVNLSRTSKWLRAFLMSKEKSRTSVWKRVFQATEMLPTCPDELSEPQYACLLFGGVCDECGREYRGRGVYDLRRYISHFRIICVTCRRKSFVAWDDLPFKVRSDFGHICPVDQPPGCRDEKYHVQTLAMLKAQYEGKEDDAAKEAWIREKAEERKSRKEFSRKCREFFKFEEKQRRETEKRMREERKARIIERLRSLGWGSECDSFFNDEITGCFEIERKHARGFDTWATARVTDDEWSRIENDMVALMQAERDYIQRIADKYTMLARLEKWFKPAYSAYVFSQPPNTPFPSALEVAMMPEWRDALCGTPLDGPEDERFSERVELAKSRIPEFVNRLIGERTAQLLDVVRKSETYRGDPKSVTVDTLTWASSIFRCRCHDKSSYPAILTHVCHTNGFFGSSRLLDKSKKDEDTDVVKPGFADLKPTNKLEQSILDAYSKEPHFVKSWAGWHSSLAFDDSAHDHMVGMLDALGWSRTTTTVEMEERQPYLECLCPCYHTPSDDPMTDTPLLEEHGPNARKAMRWEKALHHCRPHKGKQTRKSAIRYAPLQGRHLSIAQEIEAQRVRSPNNACFYCSNNETLRYGWRVGFHEFFEHLDDRHGIKHPDGEDALKTYVKNHTLYSGREPWVYDEKAFVLT